MLLDPPGSTYWKSWYQFVDRELAGRGLISREDLTFVRLAEEPRSATDWITEFYRVYHSQRYVGRRLILRLNRDVSDETLATLNEEFRDIVVSGHIERTAATPQEIEDGDNTELPRLALHFDRRSYARLRAMIDAINRDGDVEDPGRPSWSG
ncbi:MAG: hypothetical protein KatS3mg008_0240 [Acidimicrobiales bacterium]|nr:MAG: hypothetical protein KatS3mg008_0240 [Acidimicrobiales bacterium]